MPDTFTFEEAAKPQSFTFEEANTFTFEQAQPPRDTSRDSYEAQLADLGLTEADAAEATRQSDRQSDLLAAQRKAARSGEYWQGVSDRIDTLTGRVVEPLTRPVSGVVGRPLDAAVAAVTGTPGPTPDQPGPIERASSRGVNLPRMDEDWQPGGPVAAGVYNAAAGLLAGLSSPDMLAQLPAAANKLVLSAWISQMAAHQPERVMHAAELFKEGKTREAVEQVASSVAELGLAELGRRHLMRDPNRLTMADLEGQPRININARGEVVDPASPDLIARNLAAPGTLRPQEARAFGPPEATPPADLVRFERVPIFNRAGDVVDVEVRPRVREIVIEDAPAPGVILPMPRGAVRENPAGGQVSFAAEAPTLLRESITPRDPSVPPVESPAEPSRPAPAIREPEAAAVEGNAPAAVVETKPATGELTTPVKAPTKPGLVSGTSAEAWADRTIAQGQQRLQIGLDPELFAAYVVKGAAHLERGVRKFSEWSQRMIAEHGDAIRPHLRRIFEEANAGFSKVKSDDGTLKQRKLAARGSVSPEVAAPHRERLKTGREAFYEPQDVARVEDAVSRMTSEELASVPVMASDGPANLWTAAQLELYRRNVATGNLDAAWSVMEQAMKTGTSLGQLINQFKLLRGATPDGVLVAVNRRLQSAGFDPMRPSEQLRTRRLAEESIKSNAEWKEAERVYRDQPTDTNFERARDTRQQAVEADVQLQQQIAAYQPRVFFDLLTTLLKGNLLAPISQAANIAGNTTNLLIRGGARAGANVVDAIDSFVRSRPRQATTAPLRGGKEAVKALARAVPDSARSLWRGSDADLSKADVRRGLQPLVAMRDLFKSQVLGPQRNGRTPFSQRLLMALEASPFAMHATAQLRLLGAVDKLYKEPARARLITEAMKLQDRNRPKGTPSVYTSQNVAQAVKYPELFLDAETLTRIDAEAAGAVYQNANPVSRAINMAMARAQPATRFAVATIAPYITTPTNLIGEWMSYNPAIAGINTVRQAFKGNPRAAEISAGKFVAGSMMLAAGYWLYQKGMISPSLDQRDEQQKARVLAGMTLPPHHINMTGLERALKGEDPTWRAGDRSVDVLRAGGVAGALLLSATDVMRQREREPAAAGADLAMRVMGEQWTQMLQYGVNQSFLKGTASLLDAIQEGKMESWAAQYVDTLTAIPLPGTMNALARATREFKPEVRGDALDQRLEGQLRSRLGVFGADDKLPFKRDLWGRPLRETPEGNLPWVYHTLDVSKGQRVPTDDVALLLYGLWRRTASPAVIPTPPDANFTAAGRKFTLTREELSRLQELTGAARHQLAERILLNDRFANLPIDAKVGMLQKVWAAGARQGTIQFWRERGQGLTAKETPEGFEAR